MFWNRKKDIVLDCYTSNPFAYNLARINYGYHFIPEWWKQTPKIENISAPHEMKVTQVDTIKKCPGIVTYYKTGIVIPMWCELRMMLYAKHEEKVFDGNASHDEIDITFHGVDQFKRFTKEDGHSLKILSPWHIKCREPVTFTMSQPIWSQRDFMEHLHLLPGVLDFKTQTSTNLNYFIIRKDNRVELNIEPLTPMCIIHPHTDRKIVLKHHYIHDNEMFRKIMSSDFAMFNTDKNNIRFKGQMKKKKEFIEKVDKMNKEEWKI